MLKPLCRNRKETPLHPNFCRPAHHTPSTLQPNKQTMSARRTDILSLIHLRSDGRRPHEIRHMSCHLGALPSTTDCGSALPTSACSGSSLVCMGLTQVLCAVRGPCDVGRRSEELPDRYDCDFLMIMSLIVSRAARNALLQQLMQLHTPTPSIQSHT